MLKHFYNQQVYSDSYLYKAVLDKNQAIITTYLGSDCPNKHKISPYKYYIRQANDLNDILKYEIDSVFFACDGCGDILCPTCDTHEICSDCRRLLNGTRMYRM